MRPIDADKITADSKFIEGIADLFKNWCCGFHRSEDCGDTTCEACFNAALHDILPYCEDELACSTPATVQWVSIEDRLPDREDYFLVYHRKYGMNIARFDYYRSKKFLVSDERIDVDYEVAAEYWAELPDLPQE